MSQLTQDIKRLKAYHMMLKYIICISYMCLHRLTLSVVFLLNAKELLNCATRLLEFELKRSEAVRTLNVRLRQHAQEMDARSSVSSARYW